jgi:acetyltransferase-like isoleucine patch superfamily enzyme
MYRLLPEAFRPDLAGCDLVGSGACLHGKPVIDNQGFISIGRSLAMSAVPVPSHLTTGPFGALRIGDRVRISHGAAVHAHHEIVIGDDVCIGPFVMILDFDFHGTRERDEPAEPRPIFIGERVQLGAGVIVLRGASIGAGAVIAAHSVVSRFVPPGAHFAGVPARPQARAPAAEAAAAAGARSRATSA